MLIRPKLFLTCLALSLIPLFLLNGFNYWNSVRATQTTVRRDLERELADFADALNHRLEEQENDLVALALSEALQDFAVTRAKQEHTPSGNTVLPTDLRVDLAQLLGKRTHFAGIAFFDQKRRSVFLVERGAGVHASTTFLLRVKDFLPGQLQPDERVWAASAPQSLRSPISITSLEALLRSTVPVFSKDGSGDGSSALLGAVVGELKIDSTLSEAASRTRDGTSTIIVLDRSGMPSGRILYHPNDALLHQPVNSALPNFMPVAKRMLSGESGRQRFTSDTGEEMEAAVTALPSLNASVAATENYSQAIAPSRRAALLGLVLSLLMGFLAAALLASYWQRKTSGIDRVTEGVAAIAMGDLNHHIEARSSDAIRPLSDNLNLMTAQLREQIARETEARQFQSFVRLSAMLTHDLKNAIEALSLLVSNMERHFDNEDFRADAMKSLNLATQNLRALVARLSNPVTTLSGEHKPPQPVDLVPMLQRIMTMMTDPVRDTHRIETNLPPSLFALVEGERLEKCIENLILNALEAMAGKNGTLTIEAGHTDQEKAFLSITDTGVGMSRDFIEKQLYHPFATTKRRGVGLGLYTCREVVRANGGSLEVESREGAGTTFRVVLPSPATVRQASGQTTG